MRPDGGVVTLTLGGRIGVGNGNEDDDDDDDEEALLLLVVIMGAVFCCVLFIIKKVNSIKNLNFVQL